MTEEDKDYNHRHASVRSRIERVFGLLKNKFACLGGTFRGHSERQEDSFKICAAIYNFERKIEIGEAAVVTRVAASINNLIN